LKKVRVLFQILWFMPKIDRKLGFQRPFRRKIDQNYTRDKCFCFRNLSKLW
jgi:hypothetical protein